LILTIVTLRNNRFVALDKVNDEILIGENRIEKEREERWVSRVLCSETKNLNSWMTRMTEGMISLVVYLVICTITYMHKI